MSRRSRSKRSRKRKDRQTRATDPAVVERPVEELMDAGEYDLAIAQLETTLANHDTAEDRRSLARVIALKGDGLRSPEREELYRAALDHIRMVPVPTDRDPLLWQTRLACLAEEWDTAREYAELLLSVEEDAATLYYRAIAAVRSWYSYVLRDEGAEEALSYLDRALKQPDAWPELYVYRAKAEGWEDVGRETRRQILERGRARFPNDPGIAVELASALRDPERGLELVLEHALADSPHGEALTSAFKYADAVDSDLSLRLLDVMERNTPQPWAGIEFLRGRVELDRDSLDQALDHFLEAARRALSDGDRCVAFESQMGAAAVYVEKKRINEAFQALVAAAEHLFTDFDVRVPMAERVRIAGDLFSLDETKGINHDIALRHLRTYSEAQFPQPPEAMERLDLLEVMLHLEGYDEDGPRTFPGLLPDDYRIRGAEAAFWEHRGDHERAFPSALEYAIGAVQAGATEDELPGSYLARYWVDEVWDSDASEFVDPSPKLKSAFHKAAFDWLQRADTAEAAHDLVLERILAPLYMKRWRSYLIDTEAADDALLVLERIGEWLPRGTVLFDRGYFALDLPATGPADAEKHYRKYIEEFGATAAVANNLAIAVTRQGRHVEAAESYELAASVAEDPTEYVERAESARQKAEAEERKERERQQREMRQREKRENFLASAPERWPQLDFYKRRLLCTLSAISAFESYEELAQLAGQDVKFVPGHYRKLEEFGMIVEEDGHFEVNRHVMHLVERERSHSVYTHIIHTDGRIAFKPIFNSRNEYRFYQVLLEIFPNNLVFPNMALQGIFSYDRMKEHLDSEEFGYFLRASVDFCITSTTSYLPIVAFEADSYWHETERQKERDAVKDKIFRAGGVALVRLRPFGRPSEAALRGDVIRSVQEWLGSRRPEEAPAHGLDPVADLDLSHLTQLAG